MSTSNSHEPIPPGIDTAPDRAAENGLKPAVCPPVPDRCRPQTTRGPAALTRSPSRTRACCRVAGRRVPRVEMR
jgi:hypothetical protein